MVVSVITLFPLLVSGCYWRVAIVVGEWLLLLNGNYGTMIANNSSLMT
jgi:hypothetical protein